MDLNSALTHRLVPVIVVESVETCLRLAETLAEAGLPIMEITLRTPAALEAISATAQRFPGMTLGAGTVLNTDMLQRARDAGATFAVSPGIDDGVLTLAEEENFPVLPGVITPSEVMRAIAHGCKTLKFFPAEAAGGTEMLKALTGAFGHTGVRFVPTGGINATKAPAYWALKSVAAVGGSWFVDPKLLAIGDFKAIGDRTREALELSRS